MRIRAAVGADRKKVHVEASVDIKSMGDVATASTVYRGAPVSIQVPSVKRRNIDAVAEDKEAVLERVKSKVPTMDAQKLARAVKDYGGVRARKFFTPLLKKHSHGRLVPASA